MLWLEVLLNDQLDVTPWQADPAVQDAYHTACRWYTHYRRLLMYLFDRAPLPVDSGPIEFREYGRLPRQSTLPTLTAEQISTFLTHYVTDTGESINLYCKSLTSPNG